MSIVDERVLEYLQEHEFGSPAEIRKNAGIPYTGEYVAERCRELADRGMIQRVSRAVYRLTDRGESYLAGEYDAREDVDEGNSSPPAPA